MNEECLNNNQTEILNLGLATSTANCFCKIGLEFSIISRETNVIVDEEEYRNAVGLLTFLELSDYFSDDTENLRAALIESISSGPAVDPKIDNLFNY